MLLSKTVSGFGRIYHPLGAGAQFSDLISEIDEYFQHGISLRPGDVVFDVGANIGAFALHAARRAGGGLEMYCFEPIPPVFAALQKNFAESDLLRDSKPHLFPVGLTRSDAPREAVFHYFKRLPCDTTQHIDEKRGEFDAFFQSKGQAVRRKLSKVLPDAVAALAAAPVATVGKNPISRAVFDQIIGETKLHCPLTTIDEVVRDHSVERIDLLKVDVEGAELDVLLGMNDSSWRLVRQVVMEGHDKDGRLETIKALLTQHGFDFIRSEVPPLAVERALNNFILHARRTTS